MKKEDTLTNNGNNKGKLMLELEDFTLALDDKIELANRNNKCCLIPILRDIRRDMQRSVDAYKNSLMSFDDVYEEITHLHVFTEIYLKVEPVNQIELVSAH
jgi:hypothetical protein